MTAFRRDGAYDCDHACMYIYINRLHAAKLGQGTHTHT